MKIKKTVSQNENRQETLPCSETSNLKIKRQRFSLGYLMLCFVVLSGCQTSRKIVKEDSLPHGHWIAKLKLDENATGKSYLMDVNVNAVAHQKMQVDLSSIVTGPLASLALRGNKLTLISIKKREFYKGKSTSKVLGKMLSVPLHPTVLYNIFFDKRIRRKGWSCGINEAGLVSSCIKEKAGIKITWHDRIGKKKVVSIFHKRANLKLSITNFDDKLENRESLFHLSIPKSFKAIEL